RLFLSSQKLSIVAVGKAKAVIFY
ncbi:ADP-heptose--LPS heptosyltransferase 2, partial [Haemophilus influenzae]